MYIDRKLLKFAVSLFIVNLLFLSSSMAANDTPDSLVFDNRVYTEQTEKAMDKMHHLFIKAYDKTSPSGDREKAKREYLEMGQNLIRQLHERVMTLDVKRGAALSHTDVLLSVHMMSMMLDMLASIQQEQWVDPSM